MPRGSKLDVDFSIILNEIVHTRIHAPQVLIPQWKFVMACMYNHTEDGYSELDILPIIIFLT